MNYQYIPYLWLLALSFSILIFLAFISLKYKEVPGSKIFGLCMINFAFWTFCNGLELAGTNLETKLFWTNMQYFSYTTIHVLWLYMVLLFTGKKSWIKLKSILPLFIVPVIIIVLVWTDKYHGLMRYGFSLKEVNGFTVIDKNYGPLYWIHPIYGYGIVFISIFLVIKSVFIHKSIYRMQAIALLVSPLISIIPSMLYVLSLSPVKAFDVTPAFLGFSGIVALVGLYKYKLFEIIPVARDTAVDNINIGMIVLDNRDILVDANITAQEQLRLGLETLEGLSGREVVKFLDIDWLELNRLKKLKESVLFKDSPNKKYFEVQLSPVINKQETKVGKVILIRDITENVHSQNKIIEQSNQLAVSKERERMVRNLHDDLGQVLAYINVQAQGIQNELSNKGVETAKENILKLVEVSKSANENIRSYIRNTRFINSEQKDFLDILRETLEEFRKYSSIEVNLEIPNDSFIEKLSSKKRVNILYIIKEALNNVKRHSLKARKVKISFAREDNQLEVIIKDNGEGFDINNIDKSKSFGLNIMDERANDIGGELTIKSQLLVGTEIKLILPVKDVGNNYE